MDEVKKIEHYKILNTGTSENSATDLDSFLKKTKKNKDMREIVAGSILQLLRQTQDSYFPILEKKNGQMKSIDNKSSLQVDRNSSFSLQTNGIEQLSTKKVLNMTSRDQGVNSELSDKTIQFKGESIMVSIQKKSRFKTTVIIKSVKKNIAMETKKMESRPIY